MREVWQIVRIELRRKWPFAAILLLLWLFICQAFRLGIRSYYGGTVDAASDVAGPIVMLSCMIYALILGATLFQAAEKDGVRFFLYHHPVSRSHLYLVRYLTGLAIVALLSVLTASLTPSLSSTSWSQIVETTEFWRQEGWVVAFACLLVYTASAFFSPLFATDLITVPVAAAYSAAFASGGWFLAASVPERYYFRVAVVTDIAWAFVVVACVWRLFSERWFLEVFIAVAVVFFGLLLLLPHDVLRLSLPWLLGALGLFLFGWRLFARRRILECSWRQRSALAAVLIVGTGLALLAFNLLDPVGLFNLMGIDLMAGVKARR